MAELKPVYLITGSDRPKVQLAVTRLRSHFDPTTVEHLSAEQASGEEVAAACNSLGLLAGGRRLVLVTEVDGHRNQENRLVGGWKAADVEAVVSYLASPSPDTVLALVAQEAGKTSPLGKACAKAGDVLLYEAQKKRLTGWVAEQFKQLGAKAQPEACRLLVELVGQNTDELRIEVEKLAVWAHGEEITPEHVDELVWDRGEVTSWALTDAWGEGDVGEALRAGERLLQKDKTPTGIAWSLADHVGFVTACRRLAAAGIGTAEAMKRLKKRSEYPVKKAYAQGEKLDERELADAVVRLAELDVALKGGSRLPDRLELERALVDVTRGDSHPARS
jgi:DNA polymerase-3 subunit delta